MLIDNAEQERIGWTKMLPPPPADSEANSTLRHFSDTVWGGECNNHLSIRHVPRQRAGARAAFDDGVLLSTAVKHAQSRCKLLFRPFVGRQLMRRRNWSSSEYLYSSLSLPFFSSLVGCGGGDFNFQFLCWRRFEGVRGG